MAHFAQLDKNDVVINVIVVNNSELRDQNGIESEQKGIDFCKSIFGANTNWIQTSYNSKFRKRYAGIGMRYDRTLNEFVIPSGVDE